MSLDEINRCKVVHELFQEHSDDYGASYVFGKVQYEKKAGKWKQCLLVLTRLNVYVLKADSHQMLQKFPVDACAPQLEGDKLHLSAAGLTFTLHSRERSVLRDAEERINELSQKLRESAAAPSHKAKDDEPSPHGQASRHSTSPPRTSKNVSFKDPHSKAHSTDDDTPASPFTSDRRFLIGNIATCEIRDYSAIRSVYNMCEKEGRDDSGQESRRLVAQLKEYIEKEKEDVEKVVGQQARSFMSAVDECPALQPRSTQALRERLDHVSEKVSSGTGELYSAGCDLVSARLEHSNIIAAVQEVEMCRKAAALHHKAELLLKERKYYPALLASQDLEEKVRPLLSHKYGQWVFYDAIPAIRQRVKASVQRDFNAWLTTARQMAEVFGDSALDWAEERILCGGGGTPEDQRHVELVMDDDDDDMSGVSHQRGKRSQLQRRNSSTMDTQSLSTVRGDDDWADELLWDVQQVDTRPQQALGAAQFLEGLSDAMITTKDPDHVSLRAVHTTQRVYKLLDPSGGEAALRRYYISNRQKQLNLILQSAQGKAGAASLAWIARVTGFFLVDLVVMQSTHPPLTHDYHIQGLWEDTVLRIQGWLFDYAKSDELTWKDFIETKDRVRRMAVALEDLWAIGGDSAHRLGPLYEGIGRLEQAAMQMLHVSAMSRIDAILSSEKYQIIALMNPPPKEEQYRSLFLHLCSATSGPTALPKCSDTVVQVLHVIMEALHAAFRIHSGMRDADDEVRGHIEALLQHVACQLDERTGKLGQTNTTQILMNSVNAGAYDAGALGLAQAFATKASSNHVHDARLKVFSASRRRLRDCQRRFEDRGAALLQVQVRGYLAPLQAGMWLNHPGDPRKSMLMEITLDQYLASNWMRRERHLPPLTARRMKCIETNEVDKCLVSLAASLACADSIPNGKRKAALAQLRVDVDYLTQLCTQSNVTFNSFHAQAEALVAQAEKMDQLAPAAPAVQRPLPQPETEKKSEGRFFGRFGLRK